MLLHNDEHYRVELGDCVSAMLHEMPPASVDLCVTSPPFSAGDASGLSMYAYTDRGEDLGNDQDEPESKVHFSYWFRGLKRVVKPGRVIIVDCMPIPRLKRAGGQGLFDFRGFLIRLGERAGLVYEYDWVVRHNPQAQAATTKSWELKFAGLESDRARSRGALPNYLIKFTVPGRNDKPLVEPDQVNRNRWIQLAECQWEARKYRVDASGKMAMTLNYKAAKGKDDVKHLCPFPLSIPHDLVMMFSDPGETVWDPFAGIATVGFVSLLNGRKFYGMDLKPDYLTQARKNLDRALRMRDGGETPMLPWMTEDQDDAEDVTEGENDGETEDPVESEELIPGHAM